MYKIYICKTKIDNPCTDENEVYLENLVEKLYQFDSFDKDQMKEISDEIFTFVRSITAENSKIKLLNVIIIKPVV